MSDAVEADDKPSVAEVVDRIAEVAQATHAADVGDATKDRANGPVIVHEALADGSMAVTLEDGRISKIHFAPATSRRRVSTVSDELVALVNRALAAHEQAVLAELKGSDGEFGTLLSSLGQLQADLHHAFTDELRGLDN